MGGFTLRQLGQLPTSFENVYASTYTCLNIVDLHGRGVAMVGEELACSVDGDLQVRDVPHRRAGGSRRCTPTPRVFHLRHVVYKCISVDLDLITTRIRKIRSQQRS